MTRALLLTHAGATLGMVGLIWTVQVVHYPLFDGVGADAFPSYEARHSSAIGRLLILPAGLEVITAATLVVVRPPGVPMWLVLGAGAVLAGIWIMTALVQAPAHGLLSDGFDAAVHRRLVDSNWWRTIGWSVRGVAALAMVGLWSP